MKLVFAISGELQIRWASARDQPKKRKNMPLQKKVVHLPPKTSIIYSLKIENYARNFE
jgi:hypothetical protein